MNNSQPMTSKHIIDGLCHYDTDITRKYFYGYCRQAYNLYNQKYQLWNKTGLDFYSLAHEYYIYLLRHSFKPLKDMPEDTELQKWITHGFHFVVLDALKAYNREFEHQQEEMSNDILDYLRSGNSEEGLLEQVTKAVETYYSDPTMTEIARMIVYSGYKQKEVAEKLGITPAAVNQRYKKMMDEVIRPFVRANYAQGISGFASSTMPIGAESGILPSMMCRSNNSESADYSFPVPALPTDNRVTPPAINNLKPNEVYVFGSTLEGIHVGREASIALNQWGAQTGRGVGRQGQTYAIPTMLGGVDTLKKYIKDFITYAREHPDLQFLVTMIGCDIAGYDPAEIAPLFAMAKTVSNISLPEEFWKFCDIRRLRDSIPDMTF